MIRGLHYFKESIMTEAEKIESAIGVELPVEAFTLLDRTGSLNATIQDVFDILDADPGTPLSEFREWVFEKLEMIWQTEHLRRAFLEW